MSYQVTETNRISNAKWVECEFILVDDAAEMPDLRLYKSFPNCSFVEDLIDIAKQLDPLQCRAEYLRRLGFAELGVET
jgi:hypothetical protein